MLNRRNIRAFLSTQANPMEVFLVSAAVVLGFSFFLWVFSRNWLITGVDGPYYLIQVESLLETGGLAYGDPPLTFYLLTLFSLLVGDVMLGVKIGVSFFCALSTVPVFYIMKRVAGGVSAGFLGMLLVVFSAPYLRMMSDFMKNAIGVCWLLGFMYYLHDLAFSGFRRKSLALATCFLLFTGLTHILDFGVALLFLAVYTAMILIQGINRRSMLKTVGVLAAATCVFIVVAATFFGALFTDFAKVFSFFSALTSPQTRAPQNPVQQPPRPGPKPAPFGPVMGDSLSIVGGYGVVLLVLICGACFSYYAWRKNEKEASMLLGAVTITTCVISLPFIPNEWLSRFLLMFVVPTAIILSHSVSKAATLVSKNARPSAFCIMAGICLVLLGTHAITVATRLNPTISTIEYLDLIDMKSQIPSNSIVVAPPQNVNYWIQYIADADVGPLSALTFQSYSHVFIIFEKGQPPPNPQMQKREIIFVGRVFALAELEPS